MNKLLIGDKMNLFNKLNNINRYLMDTESKLILKDNYLNIINYIEIKDFSSNKILVKTKSKIITIKGDNLVVSKMQDNEVLITGIISIIEL